MNCRHSSFVRLASGCGTTTIGRPARPHANGNGVPQDYIQALMWFNLAAAQGDKTGRKNRDYAAKKMTPADISKAQAMAREWMEKRQE